MKSHKTGMKPRQLKTELPKTIEEWLEYQEHRDRWTPEARALADKHIKKKFPITLDDRRASKAIRDHHLTSHWKKTPSS